MKKLIAALSATAILLTSCDIDFVSPVHNSSEPLDEYFNTESRMFESLVAAYDPLEWFDYFYQYNSLHLVYDIMADDVNCGGSSLLPPTFPTRCGRLPTPASTAPTS